jgi:hypothetical protein
MPIYNSTPGKKFLCTLSMGEVPEFEVFAGASHQQTPQIQVFFTYTWQ